MYDLIVVGGGPAGLTASIYALRKRLNVMLISKDLGGKTNYHLSLPWIEDYQVIRGLEVVNKFKRELEYLDFARQMEAVEHIDHHPDGFSVFTKSGKQFVARAVIIATGTRQRLLAVPGEKEYIMKGLCYSALSYAPLFIDKETVVIGNSELALRSAAELAMISKHVHLVGARKELLDLPLGQKLQQSRNVTVLKDYLVTGIKGNDFAEKVVLKNPQGNEEEISSDGTFVEIGLDANSQMVVGLVEMDDHGRIKVDCFARSSVPGIFAAGDVTDSFAEQVLVAIGEGAKAALSAYEYLLPML